ncbi:MAG: nicotinate-nicotinamide nucleotide adenylyltransferase [Acholeplasmataceae bacterium]|jgi:nicotinate-nucleotide adenylyltransferase
MIILYGGSFNPPTIAHYEIIKLLNERYTPERIVLMPVGNNYQKPELLDGKIRLEMTKLMAVKFHNVVASDYEINRPFEGTIRSLEYLEKTFEKKVALAIGADNLLTLSTWIEADKLIKNYQIIVFNRDELLSNEVIKSFEEKYEIKLDIINFEFDISASLIRQNIKKNKKYLLREVYRYIKKNKLYLKEAKLCTI